MSYKFMKCILKKLGSIDGLSTLIYIISIITITTRNGYLLYLIVSFKNSHVCEPLHHIKHLRAMPQV